jgi:hypothetical protein
MASESTNTQLGEVATPTKKYSHFAYQTMLGWSQKPKGRYNQGPQSTFINYTYVILGYVATYLLVHQILS